jgi:hypothetical protein
MRYTLWCEHQQSQPEQTGFKFVIKGPQERMPRVFDNELETSPRCFRAHKLERTRIKKCNASGETVPGCTAEVWAARQRSPTGTQCPWQWPPQHPPPPLSQDGESLPPEPAEANTENFLDKFFEPQCGHSVPFQSLERTRISLSRSHFSQ